MEAKTIHSFEKVLNDKGFYLKGRFDVSCNRAGLYILFPERGWDFWGLFLKPLFSFTSEYFLLPILFLESSFNHTDDSLTLKIYWKDITNISLDACLKKSFYKSNWDDSFSSFTYKLIDILIIRYQGRIYKICFESLHPHGGRLVAFLKAIAQSQGALIKKDELPRRKRYDSPQFLRIFGDATDCFFTSSIRKNWLIINKLNDLLEQSNFNVILQDKGISYGAFLVQWDDIYSFSLQQLSYSRLLFDRTDWFLVMHTSMGKIYLEVVEPSYWPEPVEKESKIGKKKVALLNEVLKDMWEDVE